MAEWIKCKISDIGTVVGGATPSTQKVENYAGGNIPWITPKDLSTFSGRYIQCGQRNITETGLKNCSAQLLPQNTVLFSSRAPIGYVAIAENEVCTNQGFKSVVPNEGIDSLFLFYLLKYNKDKIESMGSGTTFKEVSRSTMENIEIVVPVDKSVQKNIASILDSIDSKVEKNESINDNLEQQAQALFSNYYEQATNEVRFTDLIQVLGGGTPKTGECSYWNGNIPFFTPKDVGHPYTLNTEKTITGAGLEHCNSRLFPVNTVFVTARGTVGKVSLAGVPMAMNQSCYALAGKNIHPLLVYFYTLKTVENLKHKASGAVFDAIITRDFDTENLCMLPDNVASAFIAKVEPIFQLILTNTIENQRLCSLRDTLLPRLMSGKLNVFDLDL